MSLAFLRLTVASLILLPIFLKNKPKHLKLFLRDVFFVGLFSAGNFLFFFLGMARTTANAAALIYTATPLLTLLVARQRLGEYSSNQRLVGILLGLAGVLIILILPVLEQGKGLSGDLIGNMLIVIAMVSWTLYIVGTRQLITQHAYSPMTITSFAMFFSWVFFAVIIMLFPHPAILPRLFLDSNLYLVLYLGVFVTTATYLLHQWAIQHSSATTASLTNYLQPVFAILVNGIVLGEQFTVGFFAGSLLVFAGLFITTGGRMRIYAKKIYQLISR